MSVGVLLAVLIGVLVAGVTQRITGIGFALVACPILVVAVAVGADEAVRLGIVTSLVSSGYSLFASRQQCRLRQVLPLLPFAIAAIWPAALMARAVDLAASSLVAGIVVLLALGVALHPKGVPGGSTWVQAAVGGTLSGAMNAVAALGGPMAAAYGIGRKWVESLAPNMQVFLLMNVTGGALRAWVAGDHQFFAAQCDGAGCGCRCGARWSSRGTCFASARGVTDSRHCDTGGLVAIVRGIFGMA